MEVDSGCGGIFSVAEINSALAGAQRQRVGRLSSLIPLPALLLLHLDIYHPPSASSSSSCDLLFVSSRHPGGPFGGGSRALSVPVFLALAALFLQGFSGHLANRACHFPGRALSLRSLVLRSVGAHPGTSWTNRYSSRARSPSPTPAPLRSRGMMYGGL